MGSLDFKPAINGSAGSVTGITGVPGSVTPPPVGVTKPIDIPGTAGVTPYSKSGDTTYFDSKGNPISAQDAGPRAGESLDLNSVNTTTELRDANGKVTTDKDAARAQSSSTTKTYVTPRLTTTLSTDPGFDASRAGDANFTTRTTNPDGTTRLEQHIPGALEIGNTLVQEYKNRTETRMSEEGFEENLRNPQPVNGILDLTGNDFDGKTNIGGYFDGMKLDLKKEASNLPDGIKILRDASKSADPSVRGDGSVVAVTHNGQTTILSENLRRQPVIDIYTGESKSADAPGITSVHTSKGPDGKLGFLTYKNDENGNLITPYPSTQDEIDKALGPEKDGYRLQQTDNILDLIPTAQTVAQVLKETPAKLREVIEKELKIRSDTPPDQVKLIIEEWRKATKETSYNGVPLPIDLPPPPEAKGAGTVVTASNIQPYEETTPVTQKTIGLNRPGNTNIPQGNTTPVPDLAHQKTAPALADVKGAGVPRMSTIETDKLINKALSDPSPSNQFYFYERTPGKAGLLAVKLPDGMKENEAKIKLDKLSGFYHAKGQGADFQKAVEKEFHGESLYTESENIAAKFRNKQGVAVQNTLPTIYSTAPAITLPALLYNAATGQTYTMGPNTNPAILNWSADYPSQSPAAQDAERFNRQVDISTLIPNDSPIIRQNLKDRTIYGINLSGNEGKVDNPPQEGLYDKTGKQQITPNVHPSQVAH